jgi:hypothetical protein
MDQQAKDRSIAPVFCFETRMKAASRTDAIKAINGSPDNHGLSVLDPSIVDREL